MSAKYKRFLVKFKQNWKQIYSATEFDKVQSQNLAKDMAADIMNININDRFAALRIVEETVLRETKEYADKLQHERENILKQLKNYNGDIGIN
jgi:hypothetical protein